MDQYNIIIEPKSADLTFRRALKGDQEAVFALAEDMLHEHRFDCSENGCAFSTNTVQQILYKMNADKLFGEVATMWSNMEPDEAGYQTVFDASNMYEKQKSINFLLSFKNNKYEDVILARKAFVDMLEHRFSGSDLRKSNKDLCQLVESLIKEDALYEFGTDTSGVKNFANTIVPAIWKSVISEENDGLKRWVVDVGMKGVSCSFGWSDLVDELFERSRVYDLSAFIEIVDKFIGVLPESELAIFWDRASKSVESGLMYNLRTSRFFEANAADAQIVKLFEIIGTYKDLKINCDTVENAKSFTHQILNRASYACGKSPDVLNDMNAQNAIMAKYFRPLFSVKTISAAVSEVLAAHHPSPDDMVIFEKMMLGLLHGNSNNKEITATMPLVL